MKYLVLGPGGMGGYAMIGHLMKHKKILNNISEYSGASMGAIIATCLALNFSIEETFQKIQDVPLNELIKFDLKNLIKCNGCVIIDTIKSTLKNLYGCDPYFKDVKKKLYISALCLNTSETEYFSKDTHPDMKVIDAVAMSMAIPFIFEPTKIDTKYYIDGGICETAPTKPFLDKKPNEVYVLKLQYNQQYEIDNIKNSIDYIKLLVITLMKNKQDFIIEGTTVKHINVGDMNVFDFHMTYEDKMKLFFMGYKS